MEPSEQQGSLTYVVPTWNGLKVLPMVLDSIARQGADPISVIVVDNGSSDGSLDWLRREWPAIAVVELDVNTGFAHAVNRGIEASTTAYVALLNNDVELESGWTTEMLAAIQTDARIGSCACKILSHRDRTMLDGAGDALAWSGIALPRGHGQRDIGQFDRGEDVFGARAAAALYRRGALRDVGLFDETFFAYCEDVDWAFRAQLRGWRCRYVPEARAYHLGSHSADRNPRSSARFFAMNRRNAVWLIAKNFPISALFRHAPELAAGQVLLFASAMRRGLLGAHLRGMMEAVIGLPAALRQRRAIQRRTTLSPAQLTAISRGVRP